MTATEFKTKIREITNTSSNDYSDASLIRDLNAELSMIQIMILRDRGVLEFDDSNYSDLPVATFAISSGTREYKITSDENSNKVLTIHKVAVQDASGKYTDVPRKQITEGNQESLLNTSTNTTSLPTGYYELGSSIVFTETPNSSLTGKVWFDREMDFLVTGDTTKAPGVPSSYHMLAAYRTGHNYAIDKNLPNLNNILRRVQMEEMRLHEFEETRRGDEATQITTPYINGL